MRLFAPGSLRAIADKALERDTGVRGLRSMVEETLLDVQFELRSRGDVSRRRSEIRADDVSR
jgi:ATP-dependent Clp protease ATP-binding subunit ClpX